jgi:N-acetylmuramoyl-L-alanine amidase
MRQKKLLFICVLIVISLCTCACKSEAEIEPVPINYRTTSIAPPDRIATDSEITFVSEHAVEDFLLPIEEYSWEREHKPEFIMLHFSSAIMNHPNDPYNIDYVRDTFIQYDVSTHYIIDRDGTIHCYIPENRVAWHAGKGVWGDNEKYENKMNLYAIGIEILAMGSENDMSIFMSSKEYNKIDKDLIGYTPEQYEALRLLINDLCNRYDIPFTKEHIIGHDEYSPLKTDPGELFDWSEIIGVG